MLKLTAERAPIQDRVFVSDFADSSLRVVRVEGLNTPVLGDEPVVQVETIYGTSQAISSLQWGLQAYRRQTIVRDGAWLACPWVSGLYAKCHHELAEWSSITITDGASWSCSMRLHWRDLIAWHALDLEHHRATTLLPFPPPTIPTNGHPIVSWGAEMKNAYPTGKTLQGAPTVGMLLALPWLSAPPMVARIIEVKPGGCILTARFGASYMHKIYVSSSELADWPVVG